MRAEGYGADLELAGEVVTVTSRGLGKAALGAAQRRIPVAALISMDFKKANPLVNGHIELVTVDGKTLVHFRRKQAATMRTLYDEIVRLAPSVAQGAVDARVANQAGGLHRRLRPLLRVGKTPPTAPGSGGGGTVGTGPTLTTPRMQLPIRRD